MYELSTDEDSGTESCGPEELPERGTRPCLQKERNDGFTGFVLLTNSPFFNDTKEDIQSGRRIEQERRDQEGRCRWRIVSLLLPG